MGLITAIVGMMLAQQAPAHADGVSAQGSTKPPAQGGDGQKVETPPPLQTAAETGVEGRRAQVIARFRGGAITLGELEDAIANKSPGARKQLARPEAQADLLRRMVEYELLVQEAERRGYASDTVVGERAGRVAVDAMARQDFVVDPAAIPAAQVEARYAAERQAFSTPRQRRACLIVLPTRDEALALKGQLAGKGRQAFERAARKRSIDEQTRRQGGQLGFFDDHGRLAPKGPEWQVPEAVVTASYATEVGHISEPFALGKGHALVHVNAENRATSATVEAVAPMLRETLATEARTAAIDALHERTKQAHPVELHPELLNHIELDAEIGRGIPSGSPAAPPDPRAPAKFVEPDGV